MNFSRHFGFRALLGVCASLLFSSLGHGFVTYHSVERAKSASVAYVPSQVTIDTRALFDAEQAKSTKTISLQLPSGKRYNVVRANVLPGIEGGQTFVGYFETHGHDYRIYVTETRGAITGVMQSPEGAIEISLPAGGAGLQGNASLTSRKLAGHVKAFHFGNDAKIPPEDELAQQLQRAGEIVPITEEQIKAARDRAKAGAQVIIDLVVAYTPGMIARYSNTAGVASRLNTLVALMNDALTQSEVNLTIRLVNATQVTYPEAGSNDSALTAISPDSTNPIKATVDALREQYRADLVTLIRPYTYPSHDGCGIAWILGFGGRAVTPGDARYGFSVVGDGADTGGTTKLCDELSFAHELGHNLGVSHDRANAAGVVGTTNYAYGYINDAAGFGTIMSYSTNRIARFSNPNVICNGAPCGVSRNNVALSADAAGAILTTMDAIAAFRNAVVSTAPGAPTSVSATAGNAQVSVAFSAPASDGGNPITGYSATCGSVTVNGPGSPIIVSPLTNGTAVTCTVKASNSVGASPASAPSASVTPVAPINAPGAPTIGAVVAGNAQVSVSFTAPSSNGGSAITGYRATCGAVGVNGSSSPIIVSPLANGVAVTCTVTATNISGTSPASATSASVTPTAPATAPGAPTSVSATAGNAQVSVAFSAPASDGGNPITGYSATCGSVTVNGPGSPIIVSPLTNGTAVTCTVKASNSVGASPASAPSASVTPVAPINAPGAPTIGAVVAGNAQVSVSFTAPSSNGGSAITGYRATCGAVGVNGSSSPIIVSPLANGVAVTCTVTATNISGTSPASATSASVTPVAPVPPGTDDSDSDGIPDSVELQEGQKIGIKDNAIFAGMNSKSDRWFAMQQYRDFLGREAEPAGLVEWTLRLNTKTQTREEVIQSFFNSQEFQNGVPPVVRLYLGYFNRIPDHEGLLGWVKALRGGTELGTVSAAFANSQEFQLTYGALSDADFVTLVYRNVLGRVPDQVGFDAWLGRLAAGLTRGGMMIGFTESQEFQNKTRANVFVIMMYEGLLRRAAEQAGYESWVNYVNSGSDALDLTRGFMNSLEYRYRFLPN
jgi:hypothetical protein